MNILIPKQIETEKIDFGTYISTEHYDLIQLITDNSKEIHKVSIFCKNIDATFEFNLSLLNGENGILMMCYHIGAYYSSDINISLHLINTPNVYWLVEIL